MPLVNGTVLAAAAVFLTATTAGAQMMDHAKKSHEDARDIVAVASGAGFNTLVAAVKAAGLVEALRANGPFTVFAPTDAAFAKLPPGTLAALLKDPVKLGAILKYHVVPGRVMAADVVKGGGAQPATLEGAKLNIVVKDGKVTVNGANVVKTDVMASNGVIHVIDTVVLPPEGN